ncbi:tail protein [Salmonella phage 41]|nr:tail protein [Salmonella phage 41]
MPQTSPRTALNRSQLDNSSIEDEFYHITNIELHQIQQTIHMLFPNEHQKIQANQKA